MAGGVGARAIRLARSSSEAIDLEVAEIDNRKSHARKTGVQLPLNCLLNLHCDLRAVLSRRLK